MGNMLVSEQQVKDALKIDSFRNLSKEKVMEFISLIPNMDKEIACAVINQFPVYSEFSKALIAILCESCDNAMKANEGSLDIVLSSYRKILDDLGEILKRESISSEERETITEQMVDIANKMAEIHSENQKFLNGVMNRKNTLIAFAFAIGATILGVTVKGKNLPKL